MTCVLFTVTAELRVPTFWELLANNGLRLLDEEEPGWVYNPNLNLNALDQADGMNCLLAQLFGDFDLGCAKLGIYGDRLLAESFGFCRCPYSSVYNELPVEYAQLTAAVKRGITVRLIVARLGTLLTAG